MLKKKGLFLLVLSILLLSGVFNFMTVSAAPKPVPTVKVTSVSLNKTKNSITVGQTYTLLATVNPTKAKNKTVKWTSSNPGIAKVDAKGKVTAISAGTAAITVTTVDGNKKATCIITVSNPIVRVTSVSLNKTTDSMMVGETNTLIATVNPTKAKDKTVKWASSNLAIAKVDANGKVTAVSAGTASITVTTTDGSKKATCIYTIRKKSAFLLGETAIIKDKLYGTYELTINKVEATNERNQFSDINPSEVYKITYTYKLLDKSSSTNGLWINGFDSAFDSTGKSGQNYPNSQVYNPEELKIIGTYCTTETFVAVMNNTDKLILIKDFYTSNGSDFVTFDIETKNNSIVNPPIGKSSDILLPSVNYGLGKTAVIKDKLYGTYEFTINKVEATSERNQFSDINPLEVYKITYTYKLLDKGSSTNGLWINGFDSAFDNTGKSGQNYPNSQVYSPEELKINGTYCTTETFIAVMNSTDKLILTKDFYTSNGSDFVTFVIPTKN